MPYKVRGKCVYKKTGKKVGCTKGSVKKYLAALHAGANESFVSFREFYEQCNIHANELTPGDMVENINPECDHYRSIGKVIRIKKIPQDEERTAGNIIVYIVHNNSSDFNPRDVNGEFVLGDTLEKTEIQLKKL